jgi:hypothetical protein
MKELAKVFPRGFECGRYRCSVRTTGAYDTPCEALSSALTRF